MRRLWNEKSKMLSLASRLGSIIPVISTRGHVLLGIITVGWSYQQTFMDTYYGDQLKMGTPKLATTKTYYLHRHTERLGVALPCLSGSCHATIVNSYLCAILIYNYNIYS